MTQMHNATKQESDSADVVAWHRWLQPLQAMAGQHAPLDRKFMEAELEANAKKRGPSNRPSF